ncbi:MAG: hypothetical protein AAGC56_05460 [Pseudomonadota bacterium]
MRQPGTSRRRLQTIPYFADPPAGGPDPARLSTGDDGAERLEDVASFLIREADSMERAAVGTAQLVLYGAVLLNAGGLVGLPPYLSAADVDVSGAAASALTAAAGCFILGVFFAAIGAYGAYRNYLGHMDHSVSLLFALFKRGAEDADETLAAVERAYFSPPPKTRQRIAGTKWLGVFAVFASYILFLSGALIAGRLILQPI